MKAPAEAKMLAVKIMELSFMMAAYIYILVFPEYSLMSFLFPAILSRAEGTQQ